MAVIFEDESLFDARSQLKVWAQAEMGLTPRYRTVDSHGPDHAREFEVEVAVGDEVRGRGVGKSKQDAAQQAAADALARIGSRA
jgi:ribonuclease-3